MQKAKQFLKDYLSFGKRDRIGVLVLVGLIGVVYFLPYLTAKNQETVPPRQASFLAKAIDTLAQSPQNSERDGEGFMPDYHLQPSQTKSFLDGALFQFDPNTLSVEGWQQLGLSEKTSRTIDKYRLKGGKFYKPEDIRKIWGMPEGFYERIKNYIVIAYTSKSEQKNVYENATYSRAERKVAVVNINEADTAELIALPGIGSKSSSRRSASLTSRVCNCASEEGRGGEVGAGSAAREEDFFAMRGLAVGGRNSAVL